MGGHELKGELRPDQKSLNTKLRNLDFILETPGRHQRLLNRRMTRLVLLKENSGNHMQSILKGERAEANSLSLIMALWETI